MKLNDCLSEGNVIFLEAPDSFQAIHQLVAKAQEEGLIRDAGEFEEAVLEREAIMSTGIGLGVAVPHAKLASIDRFFVMIAISAKEIEWNSIDQKKVRLVFLTGGPADQQKEYLKIMSKLILVIKNPVVRNEILSASTPADVLKPFLKI